MRRVVVVRHAERADEAPLQRLGGAPWAVGGGRARTDPPLTARGEDMAALAGEHLASIVGGGYGFAAVHSSPLVRCLQTAAALARALGGVPVEADAGLAACAGRVAAAAAKGASVPYAPERELRAATAGLQLGLGGMDGRSGGGAAGFRAAVERIAREAAAPGGAVLVVTHREGVRELDRAAGEARMAAPYCVVHEYDFCEESGAWALVRDSKIVAPRVAHGLRDVVRDYRFAFEEQTRTPQSYSRCPTM